MTTTDHHVSHIRADDGGRPSTPSSALHHNQIFSSFSSLSSSFRNWNPLLRRHDSEFSVDTQYKYPSSNDLNFWQGAALLTADCLGTGILALPHDIAVLGMWVGVGFLVLNLPINLYAGTILSHAAGHVERRQQMENVRYTATPTIPSTMVVKNAPQHLLEFQRRPNQSEGLDGKEAATSTTIAYTSFKTPQKGEKDQDTVSMDHPLQDTRPDTATAGHKLNSGPGG